MNVRDECASECDELPKMNQIFHFSSDIQYLQFNLALKIHENPEYGKEEEGGGCRKRQRLTPGDARRKRARLLNTEPRH
jgi:hypothetical protein